MNLITSSILNYYNHKSVGRTQPRWYERVEYVYLFYVNQLKLYWRARQWMSGRRTKRRYNNHYYIARYKILCIIRVERSKTKCCYLIIKLPFQCHNNTTIVLKSLCFIKMVSYTVVFVLFLCIFLKPLRCQLISTTDLYNL